MTKLDGLRILVNIISSLIGAYIGTSLFYGFSTAEWNDIAVHNFYNTIILTNFLVGFWYLFTGKGEIK